MCGVLIYVNFVSPQTLLKPYNLRYQKTRLIKGICKYNFLFSFMLVMTKSKDFRNHYIYCGLM